MRSVVITGSSKGIGRGLAGECLKRGCAVMLSGRNEPRLNREVTLLQTQFGRDSVAGQCCDVSQYRQVAALWDAAQKAFGKVDIWINNAGITTATKLLWELDPGEISEVVHTNILGIMYGCQVALKGMIAQGSGQIYNMEGFGSGDMMRPGMTVYGTTKRALRYFTDSLVEEARDKPVLIGALAPGMVVTDFMLDELKRMPEEQRAEVSVIYNILADTVETVTPFLVEHMLNNDQTGATIEWLTEEKARTRFEDEVYLGRNLLGQFGL